MASSSRKSSPVPERVRRLLQRRAALDGDVAALSPMERDLFEALAAGDKQGAALARAAAEIPPLVVDPEALRRRGRPSGTLDKNPVVLKVAAALQAPDGRVPDTRLALEVGKEYVRHLYAIALDIFTTPPASRDLPRRIRAWITAGHRPKSGPLAGRVLRFGNASEELEVLMVIAIQDYLAEPGNERARAMAVVVQVFSIQGTTPITADYVGRLTRSVTMA